MIQSYKISVIIPVYNAEQYIDKCIESVINQTLSDVQIILVNDGSIDNSKEKCEIWSKKFNNIQLINKENGGQGEARNVGLNYANGKCIFFLDADDYLPNNALEILYSNMTKNNVDVVCGTSISVFKDKTKKKNTMRYNIRPMIVNGQEFIQKNNYKDVEPMVWLYMYNHEFLKKNNLKFSIGVYHEDCEFTLKVFYYAENISFIDDVTYYQFISDNSTMRSKNIKKSKDAIQIAKNIESFIERNVENKKIKKAFKKYVAYLYSYSLHYAMQIDYNIDLLINNADRLKIIKALKYNIKYMPLMIALKTSSIKLYKKIYLKYLKG